MASDLKELGMAVLLQKDEGAAAVAAACDVAVVGADTILRDGGIVNKVGSVGVARAAKAAGKPVYACAETIKLDITRESTDIRLDATSLFEVVPPELLTGIATERGVLRPAQILELSRFEKPPAKDTSPRKPS